MTTSAPSPRATRMGKLAAIPPSASGFPSSSTRREHAGNRHACADRRGERSLPDDDELAVRQIRRDRAIGNRELIEIALPGRVDLHPLEQQRHVLAAQERRREVRLPSLEAHLDRHEVSDVVGLAAIAADLAGQLVVEDAAPVDLGDLLFDLVDPPAGGVEPADDRPHARAHDHVHRDVVFLELLDDAYVGAAAARRRRRARVRPWARRRRLAIAARPGAARRLPTASRGATIVLFTCIPYNPAMSQVLEALAHSAGLADIYHKVMDGRTSFVRRRCRGSSTGRALSVAGGLANVRARAQERERGVLRPQHAPEPDERLHRRLQVLRLLPSLHSTRNEGWTWTLERSLGRGAVRTCATRSPRSTSSAGTTRTIPYEFYLDLIRGHPRAVAGPARQGVHVREYDFFAKRFKKAARRGDRRLQGRRAWTRFPAAAPRCSSSACAASSTRRRSPPSAGSRSPGSRTRTGLRSNATHALRAHRDLRRARRAPLPPARAAGRDRRLHVLHPARVPSGEHASSRTCPARPGFDDLMTIAVSRLMLDNFDHIKAYWIMITPRIAQIALDYGRRRHRRHGRRGEDRPHGRGEDADRA